MSAGLYRPLSATRTPVLLLVEAWANTGTLKMPMAIPSGTRLFSLIMPSASGPASGWNLTSLLGLSWTPWGLLGSVSDRPTPEVSYSRTTQGLDGPSRTPTE